jgi:hypothetical protein
MTKTELPGGPEGPGDNPGPRALDTPTSGELRETALAKVARWWPKGLERTQPEPAPVSFSREAVTAWGPPKPAEALQALGTCYRYALWRIDQGLPLDLRTAFQLEDVLAYLAGPLADSPKNSRKSVRTYLRRLDPTKPDPEEAQPRRAATAERRKRPVPASEIEHTISTYSPEKIDPGRFDRVAELVRGAVRQYRPTTRVRTLKALLWATQLAAWADAHARPLRTDVIFHPDIVEEYMAARLAAGAEERTVATEGSLLRDLARVLNPGLRAHRRVKIAKPDEETPYTAAEVDSLLAAARALKTPLRRRYANAVIALGLALGPFGGEYTHVKPHDVENVDGTLRVPLRRSATCEPRVIVALPEFAGLLKDAAGAAVDEGDNHLIGGSRPSANRLSAVLEDIDAATWATPLVIGRLRTTYLVGLAQQAHTLPDFLTLSGLRTLATLDRIFRFLEGSSGDAGEDDLGLIA